MSKPQLKFALEPFSTDRTEVAPRSYVVGKNLEGWFVHTPLVKARRGWMLPDVRLGVGGGSGDFFLGEFEQLDCLHPVAPELRLLQIIGRSELTFGALNLPHRPLQMRMLSPLDRHRRGGHNHAQHDQHRSIHDASSFFGRTASQAGKFTEKAVGQATIPSRRTHW